MEKHIHCLVEDTTRRLITEIVKEVNEDAFTVGFDAQRERIKTTMKNRIEEALNEIAEQGLLDTILVRIGDRLAKSRRFMDALMQLFVGNKFKSAPVAELDWNLVDIVIDKSCFVKALTSTADCQKRE